jgi:hypothetical protein
MADEWMSWECWRNDAEKGNLKYCHTVTLSTTNPKWTGVIVNAGLCNNHMSHGTAIPLYKTGPSM